MNIAIAMLSDLRLSLIQNIERCEDALKDIHNDELYVTTESLIKKHKADLFDVEYAIGLIIKDEYKIQTN